jgi:peptide/nickel transport system substrate-binding protein
VSVARTHRRLILLVVVAALVVAMGVVASTVAADESPGTATSASPDSGKVIYRVGWTREPDNLNPFIGYTSPSFEIWYLTYDSLVGYDPATLAPMKGETSTGLATDWSVSEDGLTWTFTIRQNATWDDGQPLTARDIAFTYNYVIQNEMENFTAYTNLIEKATAIDDYTVEFQCSKPKPDMIRHWVPILPEHVWSKVDPKDAAKGYSNKPPYVGSGPFKAVEWKKTSHVHLVANPEWWGPKPKIQEIYFMSYTNNDTAVQDLKAGTIDGCVDLLTAQMKMLQNEPGITARAIAIDGFNDLGFNCYKDGPSKGHPVLKDWKFRQALNWAVDRQKIVDLVWGGTTTEGTTIIPPNYYQDPDWHWEPPADVKYAYDPAKAAQMLDAAGYPDTDGDGVREYEGKPIELGLIARSESVQSQETGKLVVGWFGDVGITVKLEVMDEATLTDKELNYEGDVFTPDFDMMLWGWYLDYDPGSMLSYLTKGQIENWNETCWWDPEYEELYKQQSEELDPARRKELVDRMQQILYEQTPYIVTDYAPDFEAYNTSRWEGYMQIPDPNGNTLIPPFGNGGYANFLSIGPKTATQAASDGSSTSVIVAVVIGVVAVAAIVAVVLLRRRPKSVEE